MSQSDSLVLNPVSRASGQLQLPGSKSISNRALLLAALAQGQTRLEGLLHSDDTRVMMAALQQMGVAVQDLGQGVVVIDGGAPFAHRDADLFLGNAGTAFRSLTAALGLMGGRFNLSGIARMHERPIGDLVDALRSLGAEVHYLGAEGYPPLAIGELAQADQRYVSVKGSVSSQFLTALLMAAPLLTTRTGQPLRIEVQGELISQPYIEITLAMMARFGVKVERDGWSSFTVPADATYVSPGLYAVEGDASSASYFIALGTIGGGPLRIQGVGTESLQGDIQFADVAQAMGARIERHANELIVSGLSVAKGDKLKAFDLDFNHIPDAAMTAAAMAMFADGPCTLRNIASWRVKETDRIDAMQAELRKLGATVESGPDWLTVHPIAADQWRSASIETYDDHRIAMCFSLASFGPVPVTILDPACVSKTFPGYFSVFEQLVQA
ncbi:3-phosphoshikimate 1-carboxyvinyltransferase [Alcaligenes sp. MMA]|uniref:3-phosphoshikimate 1-carboxyvinyltransferase n=1 Tax=Alcaligenes sp. MMA TaxID=2893019 RepID=UPI001E49049F|nr:3-phosphoshikimate 1-carboxyvinyltransferase [Alcaligenes sp. MMA]MCC9162142.1 3-phosphoshikimate 1-carboxyvinyltransferase [Alcaligenes sp. MMA]